MIIVRLHEYHRQQRVCYFLALSRLHGATCHFFDHEGDTTPECYGENIEHNIASITLLLKQELTDNFCQQENAPHEYVLLLLCVYENAELSLSLHKGCCYVTLSLSVTSL